MSQLSAKSVRFHHLHAWPVTDSPDLLCTCSHDHFDANGQLVCTSWLALFSHGDTTVAPPRVLSVTHCRVIIAEVPGQTVGVSVSPKI